MSTETHTIPDDTAAHYERLITEAEKMRQAGADALKAAYADLRADLKQLGWAGASISAEVAAFKGAIAEMALAEADKTKRDEKGERIDDYVSLLTRARARGQRKIDEQFDPITGEFVDDEEICRPANPAVSGGEPSIPSTDAGGEKMDGSSHPGRPDATTLGIISTKSGQATNSHSEMDRATEGSFETGSEAAEKGREAIPAGPEGVDLSHAGASESLATHSPEAATEREAVATQGEATEPTSDDGEATGNYAGDDRAAANAGGDHVDGNALRVPTSVTGEGAANTALPAKPKVSFRPNCQHPENCASGTRDHCWSCRRAMQKSEEMA